MLLKLSQLDELIHVLEIDSMANAALLQALSWKHLSLGVGNINQGLCMYPWVLGFRLQFCLDLTDTV